MSIGEIATSIALLTGSGFVFLAALGLWRFDDLYSRIHAATKAITLGVLLAIVAAAFRMAKPRRYAEATPRRGLPAPHRAGLRAYAGKVGVLGRNPALAAYGSRSAW